jgi:uncharacterized phage-associated protein
MIDMTNDPKLTALAVAQYFVWLSNKEGKPVTNKKLQKLIYYAQAWSLALRDQKVFEDKIEAWVHGPAVRSVYGKYKIFGFSTISETVSEDDLKKIPKDVQNLLNDVWKVYGKYDGEYLELLSHSEDPWQKAREGLEPNVGSENEILPDEMKSFYKAKLQTV